MNYRSVRPWLAVAVIFGSALFPWQWLSPWQTTALTVVWCLADSWVCARIQPQHFRRGFTAMMMISGGSAMALWPFGVNHGFTFGQQLGFGIGGTIAFLLGLVIILWRRHKDRLRALMLASLRELRKRAELVRTMRERRVRRPVLRPLPQGI